MKISVVIPAYNEESGLRKILEKINSINLLPNILEVLVVDNNSTDDTARVAKEFNVCIVAEKNQGYGYAYKTGISHATGDIIVTMDADNTYPFEEIPKLVTFLIKNDLDFVNTFRDFNKASVPMPLLNKIGNNILTLLFKLLYGASLEDSQSGMWVFKRNLWDKIKVNSNGMAFSQEIKIEACYYLKCKYAEVPIKYRKRTGNAKLKIVNDGFSNLFFLLYKRVFR